VIEQAREVRGSGRGAEPRSKRHWTYLDGVQVLRTSRRDLRFLVFVLVKGWWTVGVGKVVNADGAGAALLGMRWAYL